MKITPLEIRQKTFEKAFRGLDKDEVQAYLTSLSQEWERILDENKELSIKLAASEKEVEKLREVENSLFKTLKTAEDTGANMIDQAEKTAKLHVKEAEMRAEAIINDAQTRARATLEESDMQVREAMGEMEEQLKSLAQAYKTLEGYRDDLLATIKSMANDVLERSARVASQAKHFNPEEQIQQAKNIAKNYKYKQEAANKPRLSAPKQEPVKEPVESAVDNEPAGEKSFFDDID